MTVTSLLARRTTHRSATVLHYVAGASPGAVATAPVIYALVIPLALLDAFVTAYQTLCFPVYGIARVRRAAYFVFDRRRLPYLNVVEQVNCALCSYANGVLAYTREIASRTETYWCPIKHRRRLRDAHARYATFFDYGDERAYRSRLSPMRRTVARRRGRSERARAPLL